MDKQEEYKFSELDQTIIGYAMKVHSFLENGFQEVIYQRALALELKNAGISFQRKIEQQIFYRDYDEPIGTRRANFVVEEKVLVEIKATTQLDDVHKAQVLNYLKAYRIEVGLLINFGEKSLYFTININNVGIAD
jgi:GxxExxY protein